MGLPTRHLEIQPIRNQFKPSEGLFPELFPPHLSQSPQEVKRLIGEMIQIATGRESVDLRTVTEVIAIR